MISTFTSSATHSPDTRSSAVVPDRPLTLPVRRTALVVDDDDAIRDLAALILEALGYTALVASNGLEALHILERHPHIDVVLLDLLMPVMNGETALHAIRQSWPATAVIVISGFDAVTVHERLGDSPPDGFIQKPFTIEKLSGALAATLNH